MINKCVRCNGEGSVSVAVEWSDGLGMSRETCGVCNGTGDMGTMLDILERLVKAERSYNDTQKELELTRTRVALYLMQESGELAKIPATHRPCDGPCTTLLHAPNPGTWGWEKTLQDIAKKAPRRG